MSIQSQSQIKAAKIQSRVRERDELHDLYKDKRALKMQRRVGDAKRTKPRMRKRRKGHRGFTLLPSTTDFTREDWISATTSSEMSENVFSAVLLDAVLNQIQNFQVGLVTNSISGLECSNNNPRNLLIPFKYADERIIIAIMYDVQRDSQSNVWSCSRVEYLDAKSTDTCTFRNVHRDLMNRITLELLLQTTREDLPPGPPNPSLVKMVGETSFTHMSPVRKRCEVVLDASSDENVLIGAAPKMGLIKGGWNALQLQTHVLGTLCHRFGLFWEYFENEKYPLRVSAATTLEDRVQIVSKWWSVSRRRRNVKIDSFNLRDLHDILIVEMLRKRNRVDFNNVDKDEEEVEMDFSLGFSVVQNHGGGPDIVTITQVRVRGSSVPDNAHGLTLEIDKSDFRGEILLGAIPAGSNQMVYQFVVNERLCKILSLLFAVEPNVVATNTGQSQGATFKTYDADNDWKHARPVWNRNDPLVDTLEGYFLDAEDDEVDLLFRRGALRANIGDSVFVVSRLVFSVENGSVDLYVWEEIDNIFQKVHHSLEINELTDVDEILSFLDQNFNEHTSVWIKNECEIATVTTRKGYLSSVFADRALVRRCEEFSRGLTLLNYYTHLSLLHFLRLYVVRDIFEPDVQNELPVYV